MCLVDCSTRMNFLKRYSSWSDLDLPRLKVQLQMLPDFIRTRNIKLPNSTPIKKVTNVRMLCDLINEVSISKEMLSEVVCLIQFFFTIPVMTSTAERTFSALRQLKTFLRSTMSWPKLNHTMMLYIHTDRTDRISVDSVAKQFVMTNERRRQYFGNMQGFIWGGGIYPTLGI